MIFVFAMFHLVDPYNYSLYSMIAHRRAVVCIRTKYFDIPCDRHLLLFRTVRFSLHIIFVHFI